MALSHEGEGFKKFVHSLKIQGKQTLAPRHPRFLVGYPRPLGVFEELVSKSMCSLFAPTDVLRSYMKLFEAICNLATRTVQFEKRCEAHGVSVCVDPQPENTAPFTSVLEVRVANLKPTFRVSETSKRHLKRQQPQSDAKSDAKFAAIVQFLTCHFTVVAFRGRCTILQKSSFRGC